MSVNDDDDHWTNYASNAENREYDEQELVILGHKEEIAKARKIQRPIFEAATGRMRRAQKKVKTNGTK